MRRAARWASVPSWAAGLATNAFFGVVRTAVFYALDRERDQVAGLDMADALT